MNRFADLLQEANARLDLPQPAKSRILLELAADLDDLYEHYISRGFSQDQAAQQVRERMDLSDDALAELIAIHEPPLRRLLARLSQRAQARWERVMLALVLICIVVTAAKPMLTTPLLAQASAFVWPILGTSLMTLAIALGHFYRLYIKKDHRVRRRRAALDALLYLAAAPLLIGVTGFCIEFYRGALRIHAAPETGGPELMQMLIASSAMLIVSVLSAVCAALLWLIFFGKVGRIEQAEAACLLKDEKDPMPGRP